MVSLLYVLNFKGLLTVFILTLFGCSSNTTTLELEELIENYNVFTRWDFNTLNGWVDASQNMAGVINYNIENGVLNIYTRANTWDRPKVKTIDKIYNKGKYTWKVFVPEMGVGDMASIGAFLYNDDTHELDFEIGYGTSAVRQNLNATTDDLIVYMTSQANPFQSIPKTIKRNQWHTLDIELLVIDGKYLVIWYVDGAELNRLNLSYGPTFSFYIFCSVENLTFIGDQIPNQFNYGLFDFVEYSN